MHYAKSVFAILFVFLPLTAQAGPVEQKLTESQSLYKDETAGIPESIVFSREPRTPQEKIIYSSCIKTARALGVPIPLNTDAEDVRANSTPIIGGLVLFSYPQDDHVAVLIAYADDGFVIDEGNYKKGQFTRRYIAWRDVALRGFARF